MMLAVAPPIAPNPTGNPVNNVARIPTKPPAAPSGSQFFASFKVLLAPETCTVPSS